MVVMENNPRFPPIFFVKVTCGGHFLAFTITDPSFPNNLTTKRETRQLVRKIDEFGEFLKGNCIPSKMTFLE